MKLGPVAKRDKKNTVTSKKQQKMTITLCRQIVISLSFFGLMANLEQFGRRIPNAWYVKLTFSLAVTFYLRKTENRTKKFKRSSLTISLKKGYIFPKSVDFL